MTGKKTNNRQAKTKDMNSNKVSNNNSSVLKFMVDVASPSGLIEDANLDSEDNDTENDVEEDTNATVSFMAMKSSKGTISPKSRGGTWMKGLYECWKDNYDDNPYDDDKEGEDQMKEQLAFRDAYDISLCGQIKR
nr:hypothetical protein [Tanacetum cinerariifolium]